MPKVLLVEDNEMNRDMLSRRLIRRGYDVPIAVDGAAGVENAMRERPHIILLDMSLPVMDGWDAARNLKGNPATSAIPVIALTAHALASDRAKAMDAGCDDFATKPVDLTTLVERMERLLGLAARS